LALLVKYLNFVKPVQSASICRAIDVIAGDRLASDLEYDTDLALLGAEFELCNWIVSFYLGTRSDRALTPTTSYPNNSSAIADHQHLRFC